MKVSVYPLRDYIIEFINTRGITLASHEEELDVLFYTGDSLKELKDLVKDTNAKCVIVNNMILKDNVGFFWIRHNFIDLNSLCNPVTINTNSEILAKELYGMWGLQADILFTKKKVKEVGASNNIIEDIKRVMLWA
jgi:hypothetical protein